MQAGQRLQSDCLSSSLRRHYPGQVIRVLLSLCAPRDVYGCKVIEFSVIVVSYPKKDRPCDQICYTH